LSQKKGVTFDFPFDQSTIVFRVGKKIFVLADINDNPPRVNLKCDPDLALQLRSQYSAVIPGYHMNKEHWNTVIFNDSIPEKEVCWFIDHSYELVFNSLTNKARNEISKSEK